MKISEIYNCDINNLYGEILCECGKAHNVTTRIVAGEGVMARLGDEVKSLMPAGSGILLVSEPTVFNGIGAIAERTLRRAGFIIKRELIACADTEQAKLDALKPDEGIRLVVGVGGGRVADAAKYIAHANSLAVVIAPTSPATCSYLNGAATVKNQGFYESVTASVPSILLADYDVISGAPSNLIAAGFGEVLSRLLSLFDYRFYCILSGKNYCAKLIQQTHEIADSLLTALKGLTRGDSSAATLITNAGLRLGCIGQMQQGTQLFDGADCACANSLKMLFNAEKRQAKCDGANEFLVGRILAKVYRNVLTEGAFGFVPPPDNNRRMDKITEYFGVSQSAAVKHLQPYPRQSDFKLELYRLNEYRTELTDMITEIDLIFSEGFRVFKRLHDDDGYSLLGYLDDSDARILLSLAPDIFSQRTMLTVLKNMGILDYYL